MPPEDELNYLIGTALCEADAQWVRVVLIEDRETPAAVRRIAGVGNWGLFVRELPADEYAPLMHYVAGALATAARFRMNANPGK